MRHYRARSHLSCISAIASGYRKPKSARSKRALEAREPKLVEDAKTAIFVRGTKTGERLNNVMKELVSLNVR